MTIVARASGAPETIAPGVRLALRTFDPDLPVYNVRSMENRVSESLARRRFAVLLFACFAIVAVTLAAVGVYGVIAYVVSHSTRELGIRLALGASPRQILSMVVRQGMLTAIWGGVAGGVAAVWLGRFIRALLFGVRLADPFTLVAVAVLLAAVAFAATIIPARRAARIDPMVSLRAE
jgi:ABC-type antimicrobial peptide transport system permease subunit